MLFERSELVIREGKEDEFASMMAERGLPLLAALPAVHAAKLGRGVENPGKFMLLIHWDDMDAHQAFTKAEAYPRFRALLTPYVVSGSMEHFEID